MAGKRRQTIGLDPLDAVVPTTGSNRPNGYQQPGLTSPTPSVSFSSARIAKERLTVHVPADLIDRVRNAVYWTPGLTLAELAERGLKEALEKLEAEQGGPYPVRRSELKGGRPLK